MLIVRETFTARPGMASKLARLFRALLKWNEALRRSKRSHGVRAERTPWLFHATRLSAPAVEAGPAGG